MVEKDRRFLPLLEVSIVPFIFSPSLGFEDFLMVVCVQMLRDSSQGKVKIIHGDVLRLDNEKVLAMAEEFLAPAGLTLSPTGEMIKLHSH